MQMGDYAGRRIGLLVADSDKAARMKPFRYFDKGDMATIGRKAAVARISWPFHAHWSGFMAWLSWLVVHIFFLIGFHNRLSVFSQWAYTYLRLRDGVVGGGGGECGVAALGALARWRAPDRGLTGAARLEPTGAEVYASWRERRERHLVCNELRPS